MFFDSTPFCSMLLLFDADQFAVKIHAFTFPFSNYGIIFRYLYGIVYDKNAQILGSAFGALADVDVA